MLSESTIEELNRRLREADERREKIPDPCYCYYAPEPVLEAFSVDGRTLFLVECPKCRFKVGSFKGFIEAIKEWNKAIQNKIKLWVQTP